MFSPLFQINQINPNFIEFFKFGDVNYLAVGFYDPYKSKKTAL